MVGIQPDIKRVFRNFAVIILLAAFIFPFLRIEIAPDDFKIFLLLAFLTGFSIFLFFLGWELYERKSVIEGIPTSTIRSLPMGLVEIKGLAKNKYPVNTPVNKINCVFYRYKIEKYVVTGSGRHRSSSWKEIAGGQSITPFFLEDSTGSVLVEPFNCDAVLRRRYYYSEGHYSGARRYSEWYILPGESVYILGYAGKSNDVMGSRREKLRSKLRELKSSKELQKRYDVNKDGSIDEYEWELAVREIEKEIRQSGASGDLSDVAVSGSRKDNMLLADRSEKELAKWMGIKSFVFIFGGLAIFAVSVFFILENLLIWIY
ncbi:MAG: GIDE domain-containing protein [bacterium]